MVCLCVNKRDVMMENIVILIKRAKMTHRIPHQPSPPQAPAPKVVNPKKELSVIIPLDNLAITDIKSTGIALKMIVAKNPRNSMTSREHSNSTNRP